MMRASTKGRKVGSSERSCEVKERKWSRQFEAPSPKVVGRHMRKETRTNQVCAFRTLHMANHYLFPIPTKSMERRNAVINSCVIAIFIVHLVGLGFIISWNRNSMFGRILRVCLVVGLTSLFGIAADRLYSLRFRSSR